MLIKPKFKPKEKVFIAEVNKEAFNHKDEIINELTIEYGNGIEGNSPNEGHFKKFCAFCFFAYIFIFSIFFC